LRLWKRLIISLLETPHVAVAAAIATKVANPALSLPLALASHFVLDKIPHWNPHTFTETQKLGKPSSKTTRLAFFDSFTALGIGLTVARQLVEANGGALEVDLGVSQGARFLMCLPIARGNAGFSPTLV